MEQIVITILTLAIGGRLLRRYWKAYKYLEKKDKDIEKQPEFTDETYV